MAEAIIFGGGPPLARRHPRRPGAGVVGLFTVHGGVVVRRYVRSGHYFRYRLAPGRYQLNAGPSLRSWAVLKGTAIVRAGRTAHVGVEAGRSIP